MDALKNVVVIGGSYVGLAAVNELVNVLPATHRVLLVEPHSHFHHLFAFPRFAIVPGHEHKAFIPYSAAFAAARDPARHAVVRARAVSLRPHVLTLDRDWHGSRELPFDYAVVATGTRLPPPGTMEHDDKPLSVAYFRAYQRRVRGARSVVIVGGGAVGVQMATDLKEIYPDKDVTLVHSRDRLMPLYHEKMDEILRARFQELGIRLITGARAVVPDGGFPADASGLEVVLQDGRRIAADLVIPATGQIPNTEFLRDLESRSDTPIVNPQNGFVHVRPTLQFQDPAYPHLFAAGDIADSGAHKAARPGMGQAQVVARNVLALIQGQAPAETVTISPPAIHITLGTKKNMVFRNPNPKEGQVEPVVILREDGREDMNIEGVWERRGVQVSRPEDYHL